MKAKLPKGWVGYPGERKIKKFYKSKEKTIALLARLVENSNGYFMPIAVDRRGYAEFVGTIYVIKKDDVKHRVLLDEWNLKIRRICKPEKVNG